MAPGSSSKRTGLRPAAQVKALGVDDRIGRAELF